MEHIVKTLEELMQFTADYTALTMHRADALRAEQRLQLLLAVQEREADAAGSRAAVASPRRQRGHHRAVRLALR